MRLTFFVQERGRERERDRERERETERERERCLIEYDGYYGEDF